MSSKAKVYKEIAKYHNSGWNLYLLLHVIALIFLYIYDYDDIKQEQYYKYGIYSSLTFSELIRQGYDEDNTLLNSMSLHEDIYTCVEDNNYDISNKQLISIKDRKSRPLKAVSILNFSNDYYSYRIEIIHEKGIISNKNILIKWDDDKRFPDDYDIINNIFDMIKINVKYADIESLFNDEYKKNWKDYNIDLDGTKVRFDRINDVYVLYVGNEKKKNNINIYIEQFVYDE